MGNRSSKDTNSIDGQKINCAPTSSTQQPTRRRRIVQNFQLIWLDPNIDESKEDFRNSITHLRNIVNTIDTFTDADQCISFLTKIEDEKAFLIVSGALGEQIVPRIHDMSQIASIYVFCQNKPRHEEWAKNWSKVIGVFTEIQSICTSLTQGARRCDRDSIPMSFVPTSEGSNQNLDQLDQSFMYTQLLKEILFEMDYDKKSLHELTTYCQAQYSDNPSQKKNITEFEQQYGRHNTPIWWYTYACFLYSMLNRALRTQEVDTIIKMGFFIRDLHRQVQELHSEQFGDQGNPTLTVYRGQGLSTKDFEQLMKSKGGLISFNNFLSTSMDEQVSSAFADSNRSNPNLIGILFKITIDPSITTAPFAHVSMFSHFDSEQEILFSTHTVFRIRDVKPMDDSNRLWQVDLTLTADIDQQLKALTNRLREETFPNSKGWYRLGEMLIKLGEFDKAEQVYQILLDQKTLSDRDKANLYNQLGRIKDYQGDYVQALSYYQKDLQISHKIFPQYDRHLAASYNNMGLVYDSLGDYPKALASHQKALEIREKTFPSIHPDFGCDYNNIGLVYQNMGDYPKALESHMKSLEMYQKTLPDNHPNLAGTYNNIGSLYERMGEYSKALSSHEEALRMRRNALPPNHPHLAISYMNIGLVYHSMGDYSKALLEYEKALAVRQTTCAPDHPDLAAMYNNIGLVYYNMNEYAKALSEYEKALEIRKRTLPADHPLLGGDYNNMGNVHSKLGDYPKALSCHEQSLKIRQKTLSPKHPDLAASYNNIGMVYDNTGDYSKAILYYERAVSIAESSLSSDHPHLEMYRRNLELVKSRER